jgi:hypothetical protein
MECRWIRNRCSWRSSVCLARLLRPSRRRLLTLRNIIYCVANTYVRYCQMLISVSECLRVHAQILGCAYLLFLSSRQWRARSMLPCSPVAAKNDMLLCAKNGGISTLDQTISSQVMLWVADSGLCWAAARRCVVGCNFKCLSAAGWSKLPCTLSMKMTWIFCSCAPKNQSGVKG